LPEEHPTTLTAADPRHDWVDQAQTLRSHLLEALLRGATGSVVKDPGSPTTETQDVAHGADLPEISLIVPAAAAVLDLTKPFQEHIRLTDAELRRMVTQLRAMDGLTGDSSRWQDIEKQSKQDRRTEQTDGHDRAPVRMLSLGDGPVFRASEADAVLADKAFADLTRLATENPSGNATTHPKHQAPTNAERAILKIHAQQKKIGTLLSALQPLLDRSDNGALELAAYHAALTRRNSDLDTLLQATAAQDQVRRAVGEWRDAEEELARLRGVADTTRRDLPGDLIQAPRDEAEAHMLVTRTEREVAAVQAKLEQVQDQLDGAVWLAAVDPGAAQFLYLDRARESVAAAERRLAEVQRDLATAHAERALAEADRARREWWKAKLDLDDVLRDIHPSEETAE